MRKLKKQALVDKANFMNYSMYSARFSRNEDEYRKIWNKIKNENEILEEGTRVTKQANRNDLVCPAIVEAILLNYDSVDQEIYQRLIHTIYQNQNIAKNNLFGDKANLSANPTFLQLTLMNPNLELTKQQKRFAESEAMLQYGTNLALENQMGNHGLLPFDIRYQILRNQNWSIEEKADLVYQFYNDELWDAVLCQWETATIYDNPSEESLGLYQNRKKEEVIQEEIRVCQLFYQMRPQSCELPEQNRGYVKK